MKGKSRIVWVFLHAMPVALLVGALIWLTAAPDSGRLQGTTATSQALAGRPVRIGLIPERVSSSSVSATRRWWATCRPGWIVPFGWSR